MVNKEQVAVIVPTYKTTLSETEQISLSQLFNVLGGYDIYYAAPQRLQAEYLDNALIERFSDSFFENITGYNRLMLSKDFYRRFDKYKFILIYQLDAFAFSDCLLDFCNLEYDYIGAPWLTGMRKRVDDKYVYVNVGNGGFSLRNVQNTIRLLDDKKEELKTYSDNEDKFFAFSNSKFFKVAPVSVALRFAFERQVEKCFELNDFKLPFGCHAWERYDYDFWKPYIVKVGYKLPIRASEYGKEDKKNYDAYIQNSFIEKFWTFNDKPYIKNDENKKIVIFGTGMYGKRVLKILQNASISIECFFDNNIAMQNGYIEKYVVHAPEILKNDDNYFTIIAIAGSNLKDVRMQLDKMGKVYKKDYITYMDLIS